MSDTSTTETPQVVSLLRDLGEARDQAVRLGDTFDGFTGEFVGSLSALLSQTPVGRKAWADALKAVAR